MLIVPVFSTVIISWNFVGNVVDATAMYGVGSVWSCPVVGLVKEPFRSFIMRMLAVFCSAMVMVVSILMVSVQWE